MTKRRGKREEADLPPHGFRIVTTAVKLPGPAAAAGLDFVTATVAARAGSPSTRPGSPRA